MMRSLLRLLIATATTAASVYAATVVVAISPATPRVGAIIAIGILLFGFWTLRISRVPAAPWRPFRLSACAGGLIGTALFSALAFPLRGSEAVLALFWGLAAISSFASAAFITTRPKLVAWLIGFLALAGLYICIQAAQVVAMGPSTSADDPSLPYSFVLAGAGGSAWLAAAWHARNLWTTPRVGINVAAS